MSTSLEFFWDAASPYTYLASTQVDALAERCGIEVEYRPFLIGAAFKATGNAPPGLSVPAKGKYMMSDLRYCAAYCDVPVKAPESFPINSLLTMRAAVAAMHTEQGPAFARAVMRAHWGEGRDVSQAEELQAIAEGLGLDGTAIIAATQDQAVKDELKANCESAIERGAFGAPTFFVNGSMFFGHDRMPVMEAFIKGELAA